MTEDRTIKIRELDMKFTEELLPKPTWDWFVRPRTEVAGQPWEVTVEYHGGGEPLVYVAHAYALEEIEPAMRRAKEKLLKPPGI